MKFGRLFLPFPNSSPPAFTFNDDETFAVVLPFKTAEEEAFWLLDFFIVCFCFVLFCASFFGRMFNFGVGEMDFLRSYKLVLYSAKFYLKDSK